MHELRIVRRGRRRLIHVRELERWLEENSMRVLDGHARRLGRRRCDEYRASAIRGYEQALRLRLLPEFETVKLSELNRAEIQAFVDRLLEDGPNPSTIRNTLMPLRSIFRRAVARGEVPVNPTNGLEMPAVRGSRDRVVSREEAKRDAARCRWRWPTAPGRPTTRRPAAGYGDRGSLRRPDHDEVARGPAQCLPR
jgi:Phage integrase, N-terminal SAM-like domain